jgi:hypothetical protein
MSGNYTLGHILNKYNHKATLQKKTNTFKSCLNLSIESKMSSQSAARHILQSIISKSALQQIHSIGKLHYNTKDIAKA